MMDPSQKGTNVKTLKWAPDKEGRGYFFSVTASGSGAGAGGKSSASVMLTKGEYVVFETVRAQGGCGGGGGGALGGWFLYRCSLSTLLNPLQPLPPTPQPNTQLGKFAMPYLLGIDMVLVQ
jgi:hypothetical protein